MGKVSHSDHRQAERTAGIVRPVLVLFVLAILGLGCGESVSKSSQRSPDLSNHVFGGAVRLRLAAPTVDGPVEIHNEKQFKKILPRVLFSREGIRAQFAAPNNGTAQLVEDGPIRFNGFLLNPNNSVGFDSRSGNMRGIAPIDSNIAINDLYGTGSGTITYRYFPPVPSQNKAVVVLAPNSGSSGGTQYIESPLAGSSGIEVTVNYSTRPGGEGVTILDFTVSVEGATVLSVGGVEVLQDGEVIFPVLPYFESDEPGNHRIEIYENGAEKVGKDYIQKGLKLNNELPNFDLAPGTPVVFSNSFQWDFGPDPTTLSQASWDIVITAPNGATVTTLSGTGDNINTTWDSSVLSDVGQFRLRPINGDTEPDGGTPIYTYEFKARAFAYPGGFYQNEAGQFVQAPDAFYELGTAVTELRIINGTLTPNPPFQDGSRSVELTAEILAVGFEDLMEDDISWLVYLIGPDGSIVGDPISTGMGANVSATWDGNVDGVAVSNPQDYEFRVVATVCTGDAVLPRADIRAATSSCKFSRENFDFSGPGFRVEAITIVGGERVVGLGFPPSLLSSSGDLQDKRRELLENIQKLQVSPNGGYDVDIDVTVEFPEGVDPPDSLILKARNMVSGAEQDIEANREHPSSNPRFAVYTKEGANLSGEFIDSDTPNGQTSQTRYSIGEIYRSNAKPNDAGVAIPGKRGDGVTDGITEAFVHLMTALNGTVFPAPRTYLGRFAETVIVAEERRDIYPSGAAAPIEPPQIPPVEPSDFEGLELAQTVSSSPENLLSPGFVSVEFTVKNAPENRTPLELTPVFVKVPRIPEEDSTPSSLGPDVVIWTFHGDRHETGVIRPSGDFDRSVPKEKQKNWEIDPRNPEVSQQLGSVKTLILTGCSILDINDYNNGFEESAILQANGGLQWKGVREREYGGEFWDRAMGLGTRADLVILGYNDVSPFLSDAKRPPLSNFMAEIIGLYEEELVRLSGANDSSEMVDESVRRQYAWMSANVKYADTATDIDDHRWLALHASAIDAQYYYYVPQDKDRTNRIGAGGSATPGAYITFVTDFPSVFRLAPVWQVPRLAPPGEWGVTDDSDDLSDWFANRKQFARLVNIPNLRFSKGGVRF